MSETAELSTAVEFVPNQLYFVCLRSAPSQSSTTASSGKAFFSIDDHELMQYEPFFADFGPLHVGKVVRFCRLLDAFRKEHSDKKVFFYSSHDGHKRANAGCLIGCYAVICLGRSAEEAYRPFMNIYPPFIPFRDASYGLSTFNLTILDVLRGLSKAMLHKFFDFSAFDLEAYEHYERVEHGDLNWVVPGKFLAFSGPASSKVDIYSFTPEDYISLFKKWGVSAVVRFNKKAYDRRRFTDAGINHYDLYFVDGGLPSDAILKKFLDICEAEPCLAIHCKAGLGRTGTCIACYMIKEHRFSACEAIGWLRLARPGSVIGPQQHFLKDMEARLWKQGNKNASQIPISELTSQLHALPLAGPPQPRKTNRYPMSGLPTATAATPSTATQPSAAAGPLANGAAVAIGRGGQQPSTPGPTRFRGLFFNGDGASATLSPYPGSLANGHRSGAAAAGPSSQTSPAAGSSRIAPNYLQQSSASRFAHLSEQGDLSRSLPISGGSKDAPSVSIPKSHLPARISAASSSAAIPAAGVGASAASSSSSSIRRFS